jgi:PAS domain S-box-containing protein
MLDSSLSQGSRRGALVAGSIVLAAVVAALDRLLPAVQLGYLEIFPVLVIGATLGFRAGLAAAIVISVPVTYLEYAGGFREKHSILAANVAIMATVLVFVTVLFERWRRGESARARQEAAEERERLVERFVEASADSVNVLDADGHIVFMNASGQRDHGVTEFAAIAGADWLDWWTGPHRNEAAAAFCAARAGSRGRFTGRRELSGRETWWDVTVTPIVEGDGTVRHYLAIAREVTETVTIHRDLARSEERYRLVGASLPGTTWTATPDGLLDHISEGASAMDRPVESLLGPAWLEIVHPDDRERVISVWNASLEAGAEYDIQFRIRMAGGVYRWHLVRALPQRDETGAIVRWVGVNVDIDDQRRAQEQREKIEIGLRALAEAGAEMYGSLDFEETLRNIAEAVAKSFATACTIDLLGENGEYQRVAVAHPRVDMRSLFERYTDTGRFTSEHPIVRAIQFGTSTCVTEVRDRWSATQLPSLITVVEMLRLRSFLCVPVRASDGSVIGALTCSLDRDDPRPSYVREDIPFVEELGRRAGIAVQHARAYKRERTIAMRFQEASLPSVLPVVGDLRLSADYRPGNSEVTVGGDWYDAFALDDGRVAITIGDVVGKGLEAAVTMATLRQAMRGAASLLPNPNAMLSVAERTIQDIPVETYATALAAVYDPQLREITFATAGHPGPVLWRADGIVEDLIATGPMLGLGAAHQGKTTTSIPPGSALAFFTDGLTESTRNIDEGYRRLRAALADPSVRAAENPARAIVEHVLERGGARDDIAVLVVNTGTAERVAGDFELATARDSTPLLDESRI